MYSASSCLFRQPVLTGSARQRKTHMNTMGGHFMAIKTLEMDRRDSSSYRKILRRGGFLSASYLSTSGFDVAELKKLARQGKLDAVRCSIGKSVRWYYRERQAELAHLRGMA